MTPTTVFPPPPNQPSYGPEALRIVTLDPTPSVTFDPSFPYKPWVLPPGFVPETWTGDKPPTADEDVILYRFDNLGHQHMFVVNYGLALGPRNVAPSVASPEQVAIWQAAPYGQALPVPVRKLLATESVTQALGIITIRNSAYAPPAGRTDAEKLAQIAAILAE